MPKSFRGPTTGGARGISVEGDHALERSPMLNQMIHPSPDRVRSTGWAAMAGGALGLLCAPLYSLAYFATEAGAPYAESATVQAWAEPARDLLDPLLTFASPDTVYLTYGKLFLFVWIGMLAGLIASTPARPATEAGSRGGAFARASSAWCCSPSARSARTGWGWSRRP